MRAIRRVWSCPKKAPLPSQAKASLKVSPFVLMNIGKESKKKKEHPLSHIASRLFDSKNDIPLNPKTKMNSIFENILKKRPSIESHFHSEPYIETISDKNSISFKSYDNNSMCSFNTVPHINKSIDEDNVVNESERFNTRESFKTALNLHYSTEEKEMLAKHLELEIFASHYNDNGMYSETVQKLKNGLN